MNSPSLWNPKFHFLVHENYQSVSIPNYINPLYTRFILIVFSPLFLGLLNGPLSSGFQNKIYKISQTFRGPYVSLQSHPLSVHNIKNIWRLVQLLKLISQFYPASHYCRFFTVYVWRLYANIWNKQSRTRKNVLFNKFDNCIT
jgi:hypothetical protein